MSFGEFVQLMSDCSVIILPGSPYTLVRRAEHKGEGTETLSREKLTAVLAALIRNAAAWLQCYIANH